MKKSIPRLLLFTLLIAVLLGALVSLIGLLLGWRTGTQYSNGLFLVGAIVIIVGIFSVLGGFGMRSDFKVLYSQSASSMNIADRSRRWISDTTQGYSAYIFMLLSGGFLFAFSVLVGVVFP
jgi:hypothetical protein